MSIAHVLRLDTNTPASERSLIAPDRLLAGDPRQGSFNLFSDPGQQFNVGLWESEPATWTVRYSEHEFCTILEGRLLMRDEAGGEMLVGPGESFVISAGFAGTWQVLEKVRKIYVIFEPGATTDASP
ncbi:MAG TPA: cupin domain-containing protein [Luteimonas sp.]|nr:cupin domain-containing protein [Luteimonas sp.]